jgi:hypothetical protein
MNAADFIAFDVETATAQTNSLCQIGFVMVKDWDEVINESGFLGMIKMENLIIIGVIIFVVSILIRRLLFNIKRARRRDYYRNEYLKSDEWRRKRYVVLQRDNWRCVYCGARATQVHHKRYARKNIGKEPIAWLVSVCSTCHESQHK